MQLFFWKLREDAKRLINHLILISNCCSLDVKTFWLGITDGDLKHWINTVDYAPTTYFNWDSGEPGNAAENCGMFYPGNGKWHDYPCTTYLHPFVCKKDVRLVSYLYLWLYLIKQIFPFNKLQ